MIDFIGNGISSRALIRKGKLQYLVRTGTAGQVFTVLDEQNRRVNDATLWLAGTLYQPSKDGTITTPFSNRPGRQPIVVSQGEFSSLEYFQQEAEQFELTAAIYVDREELLSRRKARFVIRPSLRLNGTPVSLKVLENVRLVITSHDLDGVATSKEVADFKLFEDRESEFEFQTPQRLATLQCELKAKVQNLSQNKKIDLGASQSFSVNEIDRTDKIEDLHFLQVAGQYVIDVLGKSGEAQPDRPVQILLKHRDFRDMVAVSLQTDPNGRVTLGALPGIVTVQATGPEGTSHTWAIRHDEHSYSQTVQAAQGQTILVPYMGDAKRPERSELSLLELRGENFVVDRFDAIKLKDGFLQIANLPPGDYSLFLKTIGKGIEIRVADGPRRDGYVLGDYRRLQEINPEPLQLDHVATNKGVLRIQVRNATPFARVHVFAARFEPAFPAYEVLARIAASEPYLMTAPGIDSLYVAGRNIGDEYRYILDRKFKHKFPGNMLQRPSLLLNPWAVRSTATGEQLAQAGESYARGGESDKGGAGRAQPQREPATVLADFADLNFLAETSFVLVNLTPDENGVIEIKRADLGVHQDVVVVAVDPWNTASRHVSLQEEKPTYLDLRLAKILDVKQHFTQQKSITVVGAKQTLVLPDITSAKLEVYDSLARVYGLYATLNPEPNLLEFSFLLRWPKLEFKEKCSLYSKYASHELNFFLSRKDADFFQQVVQPYLANKKDKTFLDHYLLEHDLREYLKPWNFSQLNTVERILLGRRVAGERKPLERFVREQWELLPPDPAQFERLFRTGLRGSALEASDRFDMAKAKLKLTKELGLYDTMGGLGPRGAAPAAPPAPRGEMLDTKKRPAFKSESAARELAERQTESRKRFAQKDAKGEVREAGKAFDDERDMDGIPPQYYQKLDKTKEWAENNYYHLLNAQQIASLVTVNSFWRDFAAHDAANDGEQPFYSPNFAEASRNTTEMLLALAVLDLPFTSGEHKSTFDGAEMTFAAASPAIAFHEEIRPAKSVAKEAPILVSQNFFRASDRYRFVDNQRQDKFVTEEFLVDTVYGCQVVVTNPTSTPRKLDVLLQIPRGSLPVSNGQYTRSVQIDLQPYNTRTVEYYFYFPTAGQFAHYPVQVAGHEEVLGFAAPFEFHVVDEPTNIDKQSWDYISQNGSNDDVLNYLKLHNLLRVNLDRIAFRMSDPEFFRTVLSLLAARHVYNQTLWSYGVKHNDLPAIRQFLQHADNFVAQCGMAHH